MKTKQAIEKVKNKYEGWMGWASSQKEVDELIKEINEITALLQQGEKYRQMWESMVNASKCLIDPKGRKVLKMVVKDIKQGMKESEKYLKGGKR